MIVNLCFDSVQVLKIIEQYPNETILDITGVLYQKKIRNKLIIARKLDKDGSIEKCALNNYVETIGELSNHKINKKQSIRDIKIAGIPLLWITSIAVKHDSYHWGQVFFFLLSLIEKKQEIFTENIKIILHKSFNNSSSSLKRTIENYLKDIDVSFITTISNNIRLFSFFKILLKESLLFVKFKFKYFTKKKQPRIQIRGKDIFIVKKIIAVNQNTSDFDVGWMKDSIEDSKRETYNIPFISSFGNLPNFNSNNALRQFVRFSPSFIQFFSRVFFLFFVRIKIRKSIRNDFFFRKVFLKKELLIEELIKSIDLSSFINNIWLKNFSKKTFNCNYYYSDELYKTGRIISLSIDKKNTTIGVQHGLIPLNHTVYRITDKEQVGENPLPLPDKIFLWDKIFEDRLRFNSKIIKERIYIIDNLQYHNFKMDIQDGKKNIVDRTKKNLLWCTTLPEHFIFEASIFKKINTDNYNVRIRLHPVGHINNEFVRLILQEDVQYSISKSSLIDDFIFADIVITNPYSTVFYDAINAGVPVIRILHFATFIDFKKDFKGMMFDVYDNNDFDKSILEINKILRKS